MIIMNRVTRTTRTDSIYNENYKTDFRKVVEETAGEEGCVPLSSIKYENMFNFSALHQVT